MSAIKRTTCGDTTTVVYKTKPAWYLAGQKFIVGSVAVIISAAIGYVVTHVTSWVPAQYQELVTTVLIPLLLYVKKYISVTQEQSQTVESDPAECDNPDKQD
jgi:hypothetical protein